jgi:hypothetical protein
VYCRYQNELLYNHVITSRGTYNQFCAASYRDNPWATTLVIHSHYLDNKVYRSRHQISATTFSYLTNTSPVVGATMQFAPRYGIHALNHLRTQLSHTHIQNLISSARRPTKQRQQSQQVAITPVGQLRIARSEADSPSTVAAKWCQRGHEEADN